MRLQFLELRSDIRGVSIILSMLFFGLVVAAVVFLHAVIIAPDGVQNETGFALAPRLRRQLIPEQTGLLKSDRDPLDRISAVMSARN